MLSTNIYHSFIFLNDMVQKDPKWTKIIMDLLGIVLDFIYNIVQYFTVSNSLGFSIILLTIVTRFIMLPLAFKSQKSMSAMQALQPEIEKVKKKYGDTKDQQLQQKMNMEIQTLYSKHKINPIGGCLPLFIQMPIFIALSYIMNHACFFIGKLGDVYTNLANVIYKIPNWTTYFSPFVQAKVPETLLKDGARFDAGPDFPEGMMKVLNKFREADWVTFFQSIPEESKEFIAPIQEVINQKQSIEYFFSMNLVENPNLMSIGILIPLISAGAGFLSSYLSSKQTAGSVDPAAKMQQRIMLIVMPIMMGWMTINFPAGVGLYWITSSIFQVIQQVLMNRYSKRPKVKEA